MLLVDDLAAGGTKNLRHTPRGLVTLKSVLQKQSVLLQAEVRSHLCTKMRKKNTNLIMT